MTGNPALEVAPALWQAAFVSVLDRIDAESKARMQMKLEDVDASAEMEELRQRTQTLQQELDGENLVCPLS